MKWEEFEKAGFLPFLEKHERQRTPWKKRVTLEDGIRDSEELGSLQVHFNRCILEGLYLNDKTTVSLIHH